ncbi:hypothetical protein [Rummeliibacillus pycnus]|uniref:hypothetical protein n=1 Tax=Rummeliibacillus pycnus TaxID=101070 RepID=UPI000C9CC433|nr:hypothetical protein [Rummeliibacillus pycnus]
MKTLNAFDEHVQSFINNHKKERNKNYSNARMKNFEQDVQQQGYIFNQLFPSKQFNVLTQLLIKLAQTGITKIKAETLAKDSECGITTVFKTVKSIKQVNQIVVARLKSRGKNNGHYIFVDKLHANFKAIMKEVFFLNDDEIEELNIAQNEVQNVGLESVANVDISRLKEEKEGSKVFKGFKVFKNHSSNDLCTYSDVNLKNSIEGLLSKHQKPQTMLHELYVIAKGIKNKFKNSLQESLFNSLIVKAMKTLFNARYNNAYAFFSGTLTKMINNTIKPIESDTKPVNDEFEASEATNVFEQQDKLNKAKIANSKQQNIPDWFKKDTSKIQSTMDYEAKQREIMAKLCL